MMGVKAEGEEDRQEYVEEDAEALETSTISLGRAASPSEVAAVVAFLCSENAAQITGAAIPVDGGMTGGF